MQLDSARLRVEVDDVFRLTANVATINVFLLRLVASDVYCKHICLIEAAALNDLFVSYTYLLTYLLICII